MTMPGPVGQDLAVALVQVGAAAQEADGRSFAKASEGKLPLVARREAADYELAEAFFAGGEIGDLDPCFAAVRRFAGHLPEGKPSRPYGAVPARARRPWDSWARRPCYGPEPRSAVAPAGGSRGFQEEFIEFLERHHMQFAPARIWK